MSLNNPITTGGLQSPDIGSTILGNVPSIPLLSPRNYFLQSMSSWVSTPSHATQWVAIFDDFPKTIKTNILQELEGSRASKDVWNVPYKQLTNYLVNKSIGCIFCQGFELPAERVNVNYSESKRGFRSYPVSDTRQPHQNLNLDFLETNVSFVDGLLRPWAALVAHKGLVARPENESVKTNLTIIQYGRTNQYLSPIARKMWYFYDVAPVSIEKTKYDYKNNDVEVRGSIGFTFSKYELYNTTYIPVFTLIDKFSNGGLKELSDTIILDEAIKGIGNLL